MASRGTVSTLLGSGLVVITALGGVGGYGVGLLTTNESAAASGTAAPLGALNTSPTTPVSTPSQSAPPPKVRYDTSPALNVDDLYYKTRTLTVKGTYRSVVTVRVPSGWNLTQPDPPKTGRYTDPTSKRWIRIESGFSITRPPAESMRLRILQLREQVPADQALTIISQKVDKAYATLAYTYVPPKEQSPEQFLRYVIVRWVADDSGNCAVEMSSTGLPQDKDALMDVLDHASSSVERRDSPL
ncbi:hypothetical protein AB0E69_00975 [Kribbella sp. NPDC026611]|uniref:hypothetical protein n=1 Tax=Kribbella sp. NPDC026611 TaxID=3154911 RepID=UPI0034095F38